MERSRRSLTSLFKPQTGPGKAHATCLPSSKQSTTCRLPVAAQGEALASLAAIASQNKTHLPEAPLAETSVQTGLKATLADVVGHGRLRKRLVVMMYAWCCVSQVSEG